MNKLKKILLTLFTLFFITSCDVLDGLLGKNNNLECSEHDYVERTRIAPTCIDNGTIYYFCSKCNDMKIEEIPSTGIHTYSEQITMQPGCTTTGNKKKVCSVCGDIQNETLPATGHSTSSLDESTVVAATIDHAGYTGDYKCDVCHQVTTEGSVIPKLTNCNHTYTRTLSGSNKVKLTCSKCSYTTTIDRYQNINVYGINDFHGQISNLGAVATYLKNKGEETNSITIDSGDTWQGSLESNYNSGRLINEVETYIHMDARTIGNHDFDWGIEGLEYNSNMSSEDYKMPVLAANVYNFNFSTKQVGNVQQDNIGKEYTVVTLESGVKVGIVGVIGSSQITSISTDLVKNITFANHINTIKTVSDKLRTQENCDIVIASVHGDYKETTEQGLSETSTVSKKRYVDLVLNGHSHQTEKKVENGVYHVQAGCNGYNSSKTTLKFDVYNQTTTTPNEPSFITNTTMKNAYTVDSKITEIINRYAQDTSDLGATVLKTNINGKFTQALTKNSKTKEIETYGELPNLMCEALYKEATKQFGNIDYAYINNARADMSKSTWTLSDLFTAFPFDNKVFILEVGGKDMEDEVADFNYIYRGDTAKALAAIDSSKTYRIAVLDYLAYHTNSYRNYDYFKNVKSEVGYLKKNNEIYTYRDILKDYLLSNSITSLSSTDYNPSTNSYTAYRFDRSKMSTTYSAVPDR